MTLDKFVCECIASFNPWSIFEPNFWHVQNSVVTFGQDFVVPQVMESGPITKVCQYNHQEFKQISSVSGFADIANVV
jgi:hypothetical protein